MKHLATIITLIICFVAFFVTNWAVRQLNELYDLKPSIIYILILNYQSFIYFFVLLLNENKNKVAINILNINYIIGFVLYASCIIVILVHQFYINEYNSLMGAVPLGLYITLGSVFLLHGLNYLLYLGKGIITLYFIFSYCLFFCIQFALTLECRGSINFFISPVFFLIWVILFVWLSIVKTRLSSTPTSGANIHSELK